MLQSLSVSYDTPFSFFSAYHLLSSRATKFLPDNNFMSLNRRMEKAHVNRDPLYSQISSTNDKNKTGQGIRAVSSADSPKAGIYEIKRQKPGRSSRARMSTNALFRLVRTKVHKCYGIPRVSGFHEKNKQRRGMYACPAFVQYF